jgi:glycosyltransferase involved in cell wall biosynthesis
MRIAFLSPVPPATTGIADYSAEVLAALGSRHEIDVFHGQRKIDRDALPGSCAVHHVESFPRRHGESRYDAIVYQMGNGADHAFLYPLLSRFPGILVLHDLVLHHSRAKHFLESPAARAYARDPSSAALRDAAQGSLSEYEAEIAYSYPAQAGRLGQVHLGTVGSLLPYAYPLFRIPVEASRLTAVHNDYMATAIREEVPEAETARITMPVTAVPVGIDDTDALRSRYGLRANDFVVGCFGLLTQEKRIETVARAVARAAPAIPHIRLLLVGHVPHRGHLTRRLEALGVRARTIITGRIPFEELPAHMEIADVVVHLRYPTARETSASLLRVLAQGRPTVVSDLEHLADIPDRAVVRANVLDEEGEVTRALLRLARRPEDRRRLGEAAATFATLRHAPARCADDYDAAFERAAALPDPPSRAWPAHWSSSANAKIAG